MIFVQLFQTQPSSRRTQSWDHTFPIAWLQEGRHIYRCQYCLAVFAQILSINEIAIPDSWWELWTEVIKRSMSLVAWWLHFNGIYFCASWKKEIYFVVMLLVFRPGVVEQFVPCSGEHLCNEVFINIAEVSREFVTEDFLVYYVLGVAVLQSSTLERSSVIFSRSTLPRTVVGW